MTSSHTRFAFAIPFFIVRSPFCIAQVKRPCSAFFPWSWKTDIRMLMLPTMAKVDLPLFYLQTLQNTHYIIKFNPIKLPPYHSSFLMLTAISNGIKRGREVQPSDDDDVWINVESSLCEFLYNIVHKHFVFSPCQDKILTLYKYPIIQSQGKHNRNITKKKKTIINILPTPKLKRITNKTQLHYAHMLMQ